MRPEILEHHDRPPSAVVFMARAFRPSAGLPAEGGFPHIAQRWTGVRIDPAQLAAFRRATGLESEESVSVLYPHVLGFRLQMALVTHPAFPLPIWNALQIRNRLIRHCSIDACAALVLETRTGSYRRVEKGVEVDLDSRLLDGADCCWESRITYFYRGSYGAARTEVPATAAPDLSRGREVERFRMPRSGGWGFGRLTGDYNGIHWSPWYARRLGFRTAFVHAQRTVGLCMARLHGPQSDAQTLELWIKGPVAYGATVVLKAAADAQGVEFGLSLEGEHRPALLGRWRGTSG